MKMIETHAHIYLPEFDQDRREMIRRAVESGIGKILMPAIDSRTHASMLELEAAEETCISMIGLHPCSVGEDFEKELDIVSDWLQKRDFIAVGEIGLDFYWDLTYKDVQYTAFHRQIEMALDKDLPIAIHSRNATAECIEVVKQYPALKGVFHCFSGTAEEALDILNNTRFYLGIGGVVTFKNSGLGEVIKAVGLERVVLETDAPYLAPVPYRGKRNEPAYLNYVVSKLAEVTARPSDAIEKLTTENAKNLFKL